MENNTKKRCETHLFLIWSKGLPQLSNILADIERKFEIIKTDRITWDYENFNNTIADFYGTNLIGLRWKVFHCGKGPFEVLIIKDNNPEYNYRFTSKGLRKVNINIFDSKMLYRNWTGGGHRIHGTNNTKESDKDINYIYDNDIIDEK